MKVCNDVKTKSPWTFRHLTDGDVFRIAPQGPLYIKTGSQSHVSLETGVTYTVTIRGREVSYYPDACVVEGVVSDGT